MRAIQHVLSSLKSVVGILILAPYASAAPVSQPSKAIATSRQIAVETCRPNDDPIGHALPLAGHWNVGVAPKGDTFDPQYQLQLIDGGHHIIPFLDMPQPATLPEKMQYWEQAIKRAAELHLPIALIASQWESALSSDKAYLDLPPETNPNVVGVDGKILHELDPFGPVGPWREIGHKWGAGAGLAQLQKWYPDPPKVMLISNNEAAKLAWADCEKDKRYIDLYGAGKNGDFMRKVVGDGVIEHYRALIGSIRDGLASETWKKNAIFIGYDAFGPPHFARMGGWREYSLYIPGRIDVSPLIWDGGSPSYYTHNWNASTDYTVWSPQIEAMNWVFMQDEAVQLNPNFWFELGVWDGNVDQRNDKRRFYGWRHQKYDADRYGGMVQFGMWLNRPRSVREFRGWIERRSVQGQYFLAVVEAVDRVWSNPVLTEFWRKGALVANRAHEHPYQARVPEEYKSKDRWFLLDTSLDPPRPWGYGVELPVFSLALTLGDAGHREWLIYAHAPTGTKENVKVTIPKFHEVTITAPPQGVFYHVVESTGDVTAIDVPLLPIPVIATQPVKSELDP